MESSKKSTFEVLDPARVVVTIQDQVRTPAKAGLCLMDVAQGDYEKEWLLKEGVKFVFNQRLQQMHIVMNREGEKLEEQEEVKAFLGEQDSIVYELVFSHSDLCPNRAYRRMCQDNLQQNGKPGQELQIQLSDRNIKLAVCMALFDSNDKLLLTRRNERMTFPHAWVMPGGHVDPGESLEEAVVRELIEETGVQVETLVDPSSKKVRHFAYGVECQMEPFFAFESVMKWNFSKGLFPPSLGHIIIFFRIKVGKPSHEIELVLQENEVDGAVWVGEQEIEQLFQFKDAPLNGLGAQNKKTELRMSQLFPNFPNAAKEGISKAHNFAIRYLMQHYFGNKALL